MWWVGRQRLDLFIGERRAALCQSGAAPLVQQTESFDDSVAVVQRWLRDRNGRLALFVWLGATTCPPLYVTNVGPQIQARARRQVVLSMAQRVLGVQHDVRLWLEACGQSDDMVASAIRVDRLRSVLALGGGLRRKVQHIGPWWSEALRTEVMADTGQPDAVLIADTEALITAVGSDGVFARLSAQPLAADPQQWPQQLARATMGLDSSVEGLLTVIALGKSAPIATPTAASAKAVPFAGWITRTGKN